MLRFADDFTEFVFTKTLAHMINIEPPQPREGLAKVTFAGLALWAQQIEDQLITLSITPSAIEEPGLMVGNEFGFSMVRVEVKAGDLWYDTKIITPHTRPIIGAWFNHGDDHNPSWSSHT